MRLSDMRHFPKLNKQTTSRLSLSCYCHTTEHPHVISNDVSPRCEPISVHSTEKKGLHFKTRPALGLGRVISHFLSSLFYLLGPNAAGFLFCFVASSFWLVRGLMTRSLLSEAVITLQWMLIPVRTGFNLRRRREKTYNVSTLRVSSRICIGTTGMEHVSKWSSL